MGFSDNKGINNDFPFLWYIPFMSGEIIYFSLTGKTVSSVHAWTQTDVGGIKTAAFPNPLAGERNGNRPIYPGGLSGDVDGEDLGRPLLRLCQEFIPPVGGSGQGGRGSCCRRTGPDRTGQNQTPPPQTFSLIGTFLLLPGVISELIHHGNHHLNCGFILPVVGLRYHRCRR